MSAASPFATAADAGGPALSTSAPDVSNGPAVTQSATPDALAPRAAANAQATAGQSLRGPAQGTTPRPTVASTLDDGTVQAPEVANNAAAPQAGSQQGATAARPPAQRGVALPDAEPSAGAQLADGVAHSVATSAGMLVDASVASSVAADAATSKGESSGKQGFQVGRPNERTDDRIHGFTRGAQFGSAFSAYAERAHGDSRHDSPTRGRRADEQASADERSAKAEPTFTLDRPQQNEQQLLSTQLQAPAPAAPQLAAPAAPVPVPVPAPPVNVPEVVFAARPPGSQPEAASISIHHPDLGAIQLEVHRDRGRVEVHAVIESVHAEAVLRANESGIRQGVQQSGMTFSALRVRVRGEDPQTARPAQARRRRADEREK